MDTLYSTATYVSASEIICPVPPFPSVSTTVTASLSIEVDQGGSVYSSYSSNNLPFLVVGSLYLPTPMSIK
jgi:hypothetical protein